MDRVEDLLLVRAPERRDQLTLGSVPGQAVDHHVGRDGLDAAFQHADIFFQCQDRKQSLPVILRQIRPLQHMQKLEFDPLRAALPDGSGRFCHHFRRLARQAEDHVDDHLDPRLVQPTHSVIKDRHGIAAADVASGGLVHRLQAELHPDRLDGVQLPEQGDDFIRQAIWPGADRQGDDIRMRKRFRVQRAQSLHRGVGTGIALIIGDILLPALVCDQRFRLFDRRMDVLPDRHREGAAPAGAEDAAAGVDRPVPRRAGEAAVQGELVYLFSEALAQSRVQAPITKRFHDHPSRSSYVI